jgi:simple sugar transport system permease protein
VQRIVGAVVPLLAAVAAFLCAAIILLFLGASPWEGFTALVDGAFGDVNSLSQTAVRATPLLLVGAGISISFRASVINIGGEGQIVAGALLSTIVALNFPDVPRPLLIPAVMLAGVIGGGFWGAIPGVLKAYASVNEILSTIMLNIVAVQFLNYMLRSP